MNSKNSVNEIYNKLIFNHPFVKLFLSLVLTITMNKTPARIDLYTTILCSVLLTYILKGPLDQFDSYGAIAISFCFVAVLVYQLIVSFGGLNINGFQVVDKKESRNSPIVILLIILAVLVPANDKYPFGNWEKESEQVIKNIQVIHKQLSEPVMKNLEKTEDAEATEEIEVEEVSIKLKAKENYKEISASSTKLVFVACWDTNGNGVCDSGEDTNRSGSCDNLDCFENVKMTPGLESHSTLKNIGQTNCWDVNGNGKCDYTEDCDNSGFCDPLDCFEANRVQATS